MSRNGDLLIRQPAADTFSAGEGFGSPNTDRERYRINLVGVDGLLWFGHATALTAAQGLSFTTVSPLRYLGVPHRVIVIFRAKNQQNQGFLYILPCPS